MIAASVLHLTKLNNAIYLPPFCKMWQMQKYFRFYYVNVMSNIHPNFLSSSYSQNIPFIKIKLNIKYKNTLIQMLAEHRSLDKGYEPPLINLCFCLIKRISRCIYGSCCQCQNLGFRNQWRYKNLPNDTKLLVPLVYENSISHKYISAVPNRKDSMSFPRCLYATLSFVSTFTNRTHKCKFIVPNHIGPIMIHTRCLTWIQMMSIC